MINKLNLFFFDGLSGWDVAKFFIRGLKKGDIQSRSNSLAFSFFLALFPSIIFLFTLIPFIPIRDFQSELLLLIQSLLPSQAYEAAKETIEDIVRNKRGSVLSIGFLSALLFASDGMYAMMETFRKSYHGSIKRTEVRKRLLSVFLTVTVTILIITAIGLLIGHQLLVKFIYKHKILNKEFYIIGLSLGKWIITLGLSFTAISSLYYFGSSTHSKFRFVSAGSTLATIMIILTTMLFNNLVVNFIHYNKIYGSIGTLIMVMIFIKFNTLQLLIGYELNASISNARKRMLHKNKTAPIQMN